jgi:Flp pilus assembly protein TadG
MTYNHRPCCRRRGAAAVEFALVLPFLLVLVVGIWELGRMVEVQQILSNAAREAGRQASTGTYTNDQIISNVRDYLKDAGLPAQAATNANITVTNTTSGKDAASAAELDHFVLTVSVAYSDLRWASLSLFTSSATNLTASAEWNSTKDVPVSVSTTIPLQ